MHVIYRRRNTTLRSLLVASARWQIPDGNLCAVIEPKVAGTAGIVATFPITAHDATTDTTAQCFPPDSTFRTRVWIDLDHLDQIHNILPPVHVHIARWFALIQCFDDDSVVFVTVRYPFAHGTLDQKHIDHCQLDGKM